MMEKGAKSGRNKAKAGSGSPEDDYLPERQNYEELCRGQGLRMVRRRRGYCEGTTPTM